MAFDSHAKCVSFITDDFYHLIRVRAYGLVRVLSYFEDARFEGTAQNGKTTKKALP